MYSNQQILKSKGTSTSLLFLWQIIIDCSRTNPFKCYRFHFLGHRTVAGTQEAFAYYLLSEQLNTTQLVFSLPKIASAVKAQSSLT